MAYNCPGLNANRVDIRLASLSNEGVTTKTFVNAPSVIHGGVSCPGEYKEHSIMNGSCKCSSQENKGHTSLDDS